MTTLESIRKRKALLGKSKEEYDAFREKWENVYYELGKKLQPDANGFDDYGYWRLIEAVGHKNPKEFIKKQYNIELSEEDMAKFDEMVNAIRTEYPARYFETKFERPLQLSDFTAAVVPNDIPLDVESRLKDAGVEVIEYEKGDNASRAEAMQKASAMEGVRFSLKTINELNDALTEYNTTSDIKSFVDAVRVANDKFGKHPYLTNLILDYEEDGDADAFAEKVKGVIGEANEDYAPYTAGGVRYSIVTDQIENLFNEAVAGNLTGKSIAIGELTKEGKDYLEKLSGLKFKDKVSFTLNPSDLVHIHNDHFGGNEKDKGNNIPLTTLDIKRIVDVISFPTAIMYGKEKNSGRNLFYFLMDTGAGTYNLLEVYSDRKGNLSTKTYYKTKKDAAQRVMELKSSLLPTSETYSGAILSDTKIPQIFELPKVSAQFSLITPEMDADAMHESVMQGQPRSSLQSVEVQRFNRKVDFVKGIVRGYNIPNPVFIAETKEEFVQMVKVYDGEVDENTSEAYGYYCPDDDIILLNGGMLITSRDARSSTMHEYAHSITKKHLWDMLKDVTASLPVSDIIKARKELLDDKYKNETPQGLINEFVSYLVESLSTAETNAIFGGELSVDEYIETLREEINRKDIDSKDVLYAVLPLVRENLAIQIKQYGAEKENTIVLPRYQHSGLSTNAQETGRILWGVETQKQRPSEAESRVYEAGRGGEGSQKEVDARYSVRDLEAEEAYKATLLEEAMRMEREATSRGVGLAQEIADTTGWVHLADGVIVFDGLCNKMKLSNKATLLLCLLPKCLFTLSKLRYFKLRRPKISSCYKLLKEKEGANKFVDTLLYLLEVVVYTTKHQDWIFMYSLRKTL